MTKNQKAFAPVVILLIIAAVAILVVLYVNRKTYTQPQTYVTPAVENSNDLNAAANDLDNSNFNDVDSGLNQLNKDSSGI